MNLIYKICTDYIVTVMNCRQGFISLYTRVIVVVSYETVFDFLNFLPA